MMNIKMISLSVAILFFSAVSSAQNAPPTELGFLKVPLHGTCPFYDDFEQAICSAGCNKRGGYWQALTMPKLDTDGELIAGEGTCSK